MANDVVWQNYNPYKKAGFFPREFVFVDKDEDKGNAEPFGTEDNISLGLQQVLFPFPGAVAKLNASPMKFAPLAITGKNTGTVRAAEVMQMSPFGGRGELNEDRRPMPTFSQYILAAEIEGKITPRQPAEGKDAKKAGEPDSDDPKPEDKDKAAEKKPAQPKQVDLHVVLVADIDMLSDAFFQLREMGESQENEINFQFDNVTFILNVLDKLAGDERFIEIRKHRPHHHTLTRIEKETQAAQDEVAKAHDKYLSDVQKAEDDEAQGRRRQGQGTAKPAERRPHANAYQGANDPEQIEQRNGGKTGSHQEREENGVRQDRNRFEPEKGTIPEAIQDVGGYIAADSAAVGGDRGVLTAPETRTRGRGKIAPAMNRLFSVSTLRHGDHGENDYEFSPGACSGSALQIQTVLYRLRATGLNENSIIHDLSTWPPCLRVELLYDILR